MKNYKELLEQTTGQYCQVSELGYSCLGCVCTYKNELLHNHIILEVEKTLELKKREGILLFDSANKTNAIIDDFNKNQVNTWKQKNTCNETRRYSNIRSNKNFKSIQTQEQISFLYYGIRWPFFLLITSQLTVHINYLCEIFLKCWQIKCLWSILWCEHVPWGIRYAIH